MTSYLDPVFLYVCIRVYVYVHICMYKCIYVYLYKYVCMHVYIKCLEWHWLIRICRFQVYISMVHGRYVALCAHHAKSGHLLSPYIPPVYPLLPLTPFPSGNHLLMSVSVTFCSFVTFSFISHIWGKSYGS